MRAQAASLSLVILIGLASVLAPRVLQALKINQSGSCNVNLAAGIAIWVQVSGGCGLSEPQMREIERSLASLDALRVRFNLFSRQTSSALESVQKDLVELKNSEETDTARQAMQDQATELRSDLDMLIEKRINLENSINSLLTEFRNGQIKINKLQNDIGALTLETQSELDVTAKRIALLEKKIADLTVEIRKQQHWGYFKLSAVIGPDPDRQAEMRKFIKTVALPFNSHNESMENRVERVSFVGFFAIPATQMSEQAKEFIDEYLSLAERRRLHPWNGEPFINTAEIKVYEHFDDERLRAQFRNNGDWTNDMPNTSLALVNMFNAQRTFEARKLDKPELLADTWTLVAVVGIKQSGPHGVAEPQLGCGAVGYAIQSDVTLSTSNQKFEFQVEVPGGFVSVPEDLKVLKNMSGWDTSYGCPWARSVFNVVVEFIHGSKSAAN